jgi:Domain of unknown function (DUF4349)
MRTFRPFIALAVLALAIAACAGSAAGLPQQDVAPGEAGRGIDVAGSGTGGAQAAPSAAPAAPDGVDGYDTNAIGARDDAKIIRTGSIDLEVSDVAKALRTARDGIVALGGYVGASNTSNVSDQPTAQITYRIPADRWEDALDVLRELNGLTTKVANERTDAVEVTGQVVDLQARIRNLRASETALQGIASRATKISDVLEVEARLTDVRGQIEQLTAQLEDLNDRAGYATLTASFSTPIVAVQVASQEWQPATAVDEAAASLISILQAVATAGIWFLIVWLPILLVLGMVAGIGAWLARRAGIGRRGGPGMTPPPSIPAAPAVPQG